MQDVAHQLNNSRPTFPFAEVTGIITGAASKAYAATCPGAAITVGGSNSTAGLTDVSNGAAEIGDSDVPVATVPALDATKVTDHQVAIVIFAVVVNPDSGVTNLTAQQITDIFSGKTTNWKQAGGADKTIAVVERKAGSGTRLAFDADLMGTAEEINNPSSTQSTSAGVLTTVSKTSGAISYLNVADIKGATGIVAAAIDGHAATAAQVIAGTYPFFAHEHCYTPTSPAPLAASFLAYVLGPAFQGQVAATGFLPVSATGNQSAIDKIGG